MSRDFQKVGKGTATTTAVQEASPGKRTKVQAAAAPPSQAVKVTELRKLLRDFRVHAAGDVEGHLALIKIHGEQRVTAAVSETAAVVKEKVASVWHTIRGTGQTKFIDNRVQLPSSTIWDSVYATLGLADEALATFAATGNQGDLEHVKKLVDQAGAQYQESHGLVVQYRERVVGGGDVAIGSLRGVVAICTMVETIASGGLAAGSLAGMAGASAAGAAGSKVLFGGEEAMQGVKQGLKKKLDIKALLLDAGTDAVVTFVGALVGGVLAKRFMREFGGALVRRMSAGELGALVEKLGGKSVIGEEAAELLVSRGHKYLIDFFAGVGSSPLTTAVTVGISRLRGDDAPVDQFLDTIIEEMIKGGVVQLFLGGFIHGHAAIRERGTHVGPKPRSLEPSDRQLPKQESPAAEGHHVDNVPTTRGTAALHDAPDPGAASQEASGSRNAMGKPYDTHKDLAELHNHFKGIMDSEYFVEKCFGGDHEAAVTWLEKQYAIDADDIMTHDRDKWGGVLAKVLKERIPAKWKLRKLLTASGEVPFDATYDPRGLLIDKAQGRPDFVKAEPGAPKKPRAADPDKARDFLRATLRKLKNQGVGYAELQGKLSNLGVDRATLRALCAEEGIDIHLLSQFISEDHFVEDPAGVAKVKAASDDSHHPDGTRKVTDKDLEAKLYEGTMTPEQRKAALQHREIIGNDICGPEGKRFSEGGMDNFETAYKFLAAQGEPLVLRPHAGEGKARTQEERAGGVGHHASAPADDPSAIAHHNVDMLLKRLQRMRVAKIYKPPPEGKVIVRIGHATHVDVAQAQLMAGLGVAAEVNTGSNLATGAMPAAGPSGTRLDRHSVLTLLGQNAEVVLSTDGGSVMSTDLQKEYDTIKQILRGFTDKGSTQTVELAIDSRTGKVAPVGGVKRAVTFAELLARDPEAASRFTMEHIIEIQKRSQTRVGTIR